MLVKNTTSQNRSKQSRLNTEHTIPAQNVKTSEVVNFLYSLRELSYTKEHILFSIGVNLLKNKDNTAIKQFLGEYAYSPIDIKGIPFKEFDLLGSAYQYLNSKMENLEKGTFYTGRDIALDFVGNLDFSTGQTIFDPACGSGAFLFNSDAPAGQIIGVDFDPIAIMIAKFNYFIKFPEAKPPKLFCSDFFVWLAENDQEYDYIVGNPPYGASLNISKIPTKHIVTGESFSLFIEFCYPLLKKTGIFRFLLPEAALNVKRHYDVRDFILEKTNLTRIVQYTKKFSGVMSDVYMLEMDCGNDENIVFINAETTVIPKVIFRDLKNHIFVHFNEQDITIIKKVNRLKKNDLSNSVFGLGVVTGDNKTKILKVKVNDSEHIYTGKEVENYTLLPPKNYLVFDRSTLQQVAPDEIYRAPQKLVYKTINKYLKVAIDETGSLTSNSANIIIPKVADLDIYTILALLNSSLYSYLNIKMFGGVNKIAKENLMALPLPSVTKEQGKIVKELVQDAIKRNNDSFLQQYINNNIFSLSQDEVDYISKVTDTGWRKSANKKPAFSETERDERD
jgi:tRNA1(Val) A37 N6-methylase TrmN6